MIAKGKQYLTDNRPKVLRKHSFGRLSIFIISQKCYLQRFLDN